MKIRTMGAGLFHADGQTDMSKRMVAIRNFANAPKTRFARRHDVHTPANNKCETSTNRLRGETRCAMLNCASLLKSVLE